VSRSRVCLYLVGEASPEVHAVHEGYTEWFQRIAGSTEASIEPFDGMTGRIPADIADYDGVVITGSPSSLTQPEAWMEAGVELIRWAAESGAPLLGVCFGHQMIGAAYGCSVVVNPQGWELSTYSLEVNGQGADDPLFAGLPDRFDVNLSHRDIIDPETLSHLNGIRVLGNTEKCAVQALAAGPNIRGVQFHPEFNGPITRQYVDMRHEILLEDSQGRGGDGEHPDELAARVVDCPLSEQLFRNFLTQFVKSP